ncbi:hypothetical protein HY409_03505 [Candidatus Gottesmanbacteria bacterium]|nr:hypothetical protein [Candidatus Gottesmanbacteria bacterium]
MPMTIRRYRKIFLILLLSLLLLKILPQSSQAINSLSKYSGNPVLNVLSNSWDSSYVWQPSVIYDNTEFKMYYTGFNGSRFQIGLATSPDGLNWTKSSSNPIVSRLTIDNRDSHDPSVIFMNNTYEMWYASSLNGGSSNFKIYHATSIDGILWSLSPSNPVLIPSQTWDTEGISSPFVLKTGNEYKMWYSALKNGFWRIGYATSSDGVNWTPYVGNPIIDLSGSGNHADGASVIYNGSSYELFFHGVGGDLSYATSSDGIINWSTPVKVLLKDADTFDALGMAGPSALRLPNGTTLLYYGGLGSVGGITSYRIGLATDGPIELPTPTPTETPTPTPSPSLTPTPSPTPTPTPIPTTKVVVVPGFGGSWNEDAILKCKANDYSGSWTEVPVFGQLIYGPLHDALQNAGFSQTQFFYDWRKLMPSHASDLSQFINNQIVSGERIDLVGHSMGGLVGRGYLEQLGTGHRLDRFLTAGSPHKGTVLGYPAWSAGEIWSNSLPFRIMLTIAVKYCSKVHQISEREAVEQYIPSAQQLLPTSDYLRDKKTGVLKPESSMHAQNDWLPNNLFAPPFFGATVASLTGTGLKTLSTITVIPPSNRDIRQGNWLDGKPTKREFSSKGDDTVLASSSNISGATQFTINQSHIGVVQSQEGVSAILAFLNPSLLASRAISVSEVSEPLSALVVLGHPAQFWVVDPNGRTVSSSQSLVAIANPRKGRYKLRLFPKSLNTTIIVAQFLKDGRTLWKEYKHNSILPKFSNLDFDPIRASEDILK